MCFRVAIIRITEHFVFQGAVGASRRPLNCVVPFAVRDLGGFWWVLLGSGWVSELKNDTSKIIEIHCKKQCFGLRRLQDGAKMDPKNIFYLEC